MGRSRPILLVMALGLALAASSCGKDYYEGVVRKRIQQLGAKEEDERVHAAWSLGQIGPKAKAAVPALAKALSDPSREVRVAAGEALAQLEDEAAPAVPALLAALRDEDGEVRAKAAAALGVVGPPAASEAIPMLIGGLRDQDSGVRLYSAWALGEFGPEAKAAEEALAQAMEDENADVRTWSAEALLKVRGVEMK